MPHESPLELLHALKQFVQKTIEKELGPHQVSMVHGHILRFVAEQKGVTMKTLAAHLHVTPPSATSMTEGLVTKGWLARETDAKDRRVVRVLVTPQGRAVMRKVRASLAREWGQLLDSLNSKERKYLEEFSEHLIRHTSSL